MWAGGGSRAESRAGPAVAVAAVAGGRDFVLGPAEMQFAL